VYLLCVLRGNGCHSQTGVSGMERERKRGITARTKNQAWQWGGEWTRGELVHIWCKTKDRKSRTGSPRSSSAVGGRRGQILGGRTRWKKDPSPSYLNSRLPPDKWSTRETTDKTLGRKTRQGGDASRRTQRKKVVFVEVWRVRFSFLLRPLFFGK